MEAIYIPQLTKAPQQTEAIEVQEFLPDLETLTPVRGLVVVTHKGTYLQVSAKAEAIMTLTCHRCLQQYNYRLAVDTSEMIWLDATAEHPDLDLLEREVPLEDLVETLSPQGYFDPHTWLYEQMCLAIPQRNLCDRQCPGIPMNHSSSSESLSDRRWASLEALKRQLSQ